MKKNLILILSLVLFLQGTTIANAGSLFTKSSEFSKAATYGMNFATYTAEKKNGKEASNKLLQMDILFDLAGKGEEVLLNGSPDAIPEFKNNVLKIKLVLDKIAEISTKLGSGQYDEAAIASMDTMVGLINHPVVNAMWEAVKLAYESHKLVQNTKAALEIETLYGIVNNDRRLIGTSSGDAPPLIPVNSDTVTYFFNKYLIVNASTRALVKTYVKKTLGEDFPELPVSSRIWAGITFTSDAAKTEHELQQLEDYKNISRRWIKSLLQDLNKQVKLQWAQTRAAQQAAKFKVFYAHAGNAFKNMDAAMKYFQNQAKIKKDRVNYPSYLQEHQKNAKKLIKEYGKLKTNQIETKMDIRNKVYKIAQTCRTFAARSLIINDFDMKSQFEKLQTTCLEFLNKTGESLVANRDKIAEELTTSHRYTANSPSTQYENYMLSLFRPAISAYTEVADQLKPIDITKIEDILSDHKYDSLSSEGSYGVAVDYIEKWKKKQNKIFKKANEAVDQALKEIYSHKPAPSTASIVLPGKSMYEGMDHAHSLVWARDHYFEAAADQILHDDPFGGTVAALKSIKAITYSKFDKSLAQANAVLETYWNLRSQVMNQVNENLEDLNFIAVMAKDIYIQGSLKYYEQYLNENSYIAIGVIHEDPVESFMAIRVNIFHRRDDIIGPTYTLEKFAEKIKDAVLPQTYKITTCKKKWDKFQPLESSTIDLYQELTGKKLNYNDKLKKVKKDIASIPPAGSIKSRVSNFVLKAQTQIENREKDVDYLDEMDRQWQAWYDRYRKKNIIVFDPQSGRESFGFRKDRASGYALVSTPYLHYATAVDFAQNEALATAKKDLFSLNVYNFIQNYMPKSKQFLDEQFAGAGYKLAKDENFLVGRHPVWEKNVKKAEEMFANAAPSASNITAKLKKFADMFPFLLSFPSADKAKNVGELTAKLGKFNSGFDLSPYKKFSLGKRFVTIVKKMNRIALHQHDIITEKHREESRQQELKVYLEKYGKTLTDLKKRASAFSKANIFSRADQDQLVADYWELRTKYFNNKQYQTPDFTAKIENFNKTLAKLEDRLQNFGRKDIEAVRGLYKEFTSAYANKDEYALTALLAAGWDAGDGTSMDDLEENLRNMFSVYDEIECAISNLQVRKQSDGSYVTNYDITITGEMFDTEITRREKSSVSEEIVFENAKPKIRKTLRGTFWYRR